MKFFTFLFLILWTHRLFAADRVALVIGNGSYAAPLQKLDACPRDAAQMAAAFEKIGVRIFRGKPQVDLNADQMDGVLNEFVRSLGRDSEAFIYYSGHGAQIGGSNYLLPVGFNAKFESQARRQAVSLDAILELLERTESKLRVVILDSCRDPGEFLPGEPSLKGPAHRKGLNEQKVEGPETLVCFATKHGTAALADDSASYYTRVLAEEMVKPGEIANVMRVVARRVYEATDKKQLPFTYGSLLQDHYFAPGVLVPNAPVPIPSSPRDPIAAATKDAPFVNALGQEFVPVAGTKVLFCRTDVRVRDFRHYASETGYKQSGGIFVVHVKKDAKGNYSQAWELDISASWEQPGFEQGADHPVVGVSWNEAHDFCAWLSKKDGRTYRLPTDAEWSAAVGLQKYPWGTAFPPPKGAGNYGDARYLESLSALSAGAKWNGELSEYNDGYERTSPVGNFTENRYGLYDMGGNVFQWCEDEYRASMNDAEALKKFPALKEEKADDGTRYRVVRGASWGDYDGIYLRSSYRNRDLPTRRYDDDGFRCVLVVSGG